MIETIRKDIQTVLERDPASRNTVEVLLCYSGFHVMLFHRISHGLWNKKLFLMGRLLSHLGRFLTGIEIHPAAKIGNGFFIDHGMGVVIGETSVIGDNCMIYHGVTLGGFSRKKEKRHPTIGNNVIIGAGAKVLGPVTVGNNCKIGSGSVVLEDMPPNSTVIGVPGRIVYQSPVDVSSDEEYNWQSSPDPVAQAIKCLLEKIPQMEKEIRELREKLK